MVYRKGFIIRSAQVFQDITKQIELLIQESGIRQGQILVQSSNLSTGLFRAPTGQEKLLQDIQKEIRLLIPARINFSYEESPEMTAGCIKGALFGSSVSGIVADGSLDAGEGLGFFFADFDGPRDCPCAVCIVGE